MDKRTWTIFGVAVVAVLAGLILLSRQSSVDVEGIDNAQVLTSATEASGLPDHIYGKKDSKVVLIEYGDFQCPGCRSFHSNFEPLMEEYADKITFVYRNFPITQIHPNARVAAASAEAVGIQDPDKYWDMWNLLFKQQDEWGKLSLGERDGKFEQYARELGIDIDQFKTDLTSEVVSRKINYDQSLAKANGVTGTPSLFLNGETLATDKYSSTAAIRATLDDALERAGVTTSDSDKK